MRGTLSYVPQGTVGLPGEGDASLASQPPVPPLDGIWHESGGCCFYPAAPAPGPGDMIHTMQRQL